MSEEAGLRYGLPSRDYLAPEVFEAEREHIFYRSWQFACHLESVRQPGDYATCSLADQDLIVIRGRDGRLRAFYNVCQHRAHRLLEGSGNLRRLTCPYHAWTYDLDGRLTGARNAKSVPGFDMSSVCLTEVRLETFCHLVFVNLDPDAPGLREMTDGVEDEIRSFAPDIDEVLLADRAEQELAANWKVMIENYSECYHCAVVHKTFTQGVVDPASYRITSHGTYQRHISDAQPAEAASYSFDPKAGKFASWYLWPSASVQVYPGNIVNTFVWQPLSAGRTRLVSDWFFANRPMTATQEALVRQHRSTTFMEDFALVESVQRGLASRGYERGPLMIDRDQSEMSELGLLAFQDLVREALGNL